MRAALVALLLAAAAAAVAGRGHGRRLATRPIPTGDATHCNNTQAGRHFIADSAGYVCPRASVDWTTGCCAGEGAVAHACARCDVPARCCDVYEDCVSCCLDPANRAEERAQTEFRGGASRPETGHWPTPFAYCAGVCRPTSAATAHENEYIAPAHFCYAPGVRPRTPPRPGAPSLPDGASFLPADPGVSCQDACAAAGLDCGEADAAADCNALRAVFPCEAGCAEDDGHITPGYVLSSAGKEARPALCVVPPAGRRAAACGAKADAVRRLCACAPPAGM